MGGAETVLLEVLKVARLNPEAKLTLVIPFEKDEVLVRKLSSSNIDIDLVRLPYKIIRESLLLSVRNIVYSLWAVAYLSFFCKRNRVDVIYSNSSVNFIGAVVARLLSLRHIWHIHEQPDDRKKWIAEPLVGIYRRLFCRKRNTVVCISRITLNLWETFLGVRLDNAQVIYSPIKEFPFGEEREKSASFVFGYAGSLDANKNIRTLLDAFKIVRERSDVELRIAGTGPDSALLRQYVRSEGIEGVDFVGFQSDLTSFYRSIDALVLPSFNESWGLVALEALSWGKALVLTRVTGLREVLEERKHCLYIDPHSVQGLCDAMSELLSDAHLRETMKEQGRELLRELNLNENFRRKIQSLLFQ